MSNVSTMLSVRNTPYHGVGVTLEKAPANVTEAMQLAGLDYKVVGVPSAAHLPGLTLDTETNTLFRNSDYAEVGTLGDNYTLAEELTFTESGEPAPNMVLDCNGIPCGFLGSDFNVPTEGKTTIRLDNFKKLGNVGADYNVVQNVDLFKFFDPAIEAGFCQIETAGALKGGAKVWMLARITNCTAEIVPGDPINPYFLLAGSHDGTLSISAGRTDKRVVCENILTAALRSGRQSILKVRHTKNVHETIEKLSELIDWERGQFQLTVEQMRTLTRKPVTSEILKDYIKEVFRPEVEVRKLKDQEKPYLKLVEKITPFFEKGRGNDMPGVRGTLWAAYNAVTEYQTWDRGRTNEARMDSLLFGLNAKTNARAFDVALKMAA